LNPLDHELLQGMRNCYLTCGEDFEGTVGMVARARGRDPEDVKKALARIAKDHGTDPEYRNLRASLPAEFPF
jgi:hypothetical protein